MTLRSTIKSAVGPSAQVREAPDAAGAISEFRVDRPDVVFLDMMLAKGPSGKEILKTIFKEASDAKVIVSTGLPEDHPDVIDSISEGAFGYLPKPIRLDAVRRIFGEIDEESGRLGRIK